MTTGGETDFGAALFDSAIGRCGVAWQGETIVAVQLPERSDAATLGRLASTLGQSCSDDDPPAPIQSAIDAMTVLLDGEPVDLDFVDVDLGDISSFERAVYDITRTIAPGQSLTYGEVAKRLGDPGAAQAVGRALGANRCPIVVPCHRVLGADGKLVGFSANGGVETKRTMLLIEGCPAVLPSLFD